MFNLVSTVASTSMGAEIEPKIMTLLILQIKWCGLVWCGRFLFWLVVFWAVVVVELLLSSMFLVLMTVEKSLKTRLIM